MSRWSRRTQEEKDAILQKQEKQQKKAQIKKDMMNFASIDWRMKILKENELPLFCKKHGWTHSKKYILISRNDMFGKSNYVIGNCPQCNATIETMVPLNSVYTILFGLVMTNLSRVKRLEDRRSKNGRKMEI